MGFGGFGGTPRNGNPQNKKNPLGIRGKALIPAQQAVVKPTRPSLIEAETKKIVSAPMVDGLRLTTPPPPPDAGSRRGIAIFGRFIRWPSGQYPDEAYLADALERYLPVFRTPQGSVTRLPQAEWVLFTTNSVGALPKFLGTHRTIVWTLDWIADRPDRLYVAEAGKKATLFITSDNYDWARKGIRNHFYLPGACETVAVGLSPAPKRTVAFLGTLYSERRRRLADVVRSFGGEVLDSPGKWLYGAALARYCQETQIILGDNIVNDCPGYWSSRNYVIPGLGGFLLTPLVPELDEQFTPGVNIATYTSSDDLGAVIQRHLSEKTKREAIRRASFEHVRSRHNWNERARALLSRLRINA
jgi:hypothetical protein